MHNANHLKQNIDQLMNIAGICYENHQEISEIHKEDETLVYTTKAQGRTVTVRFDKTDGSSCHLSVAEKDGILLTDVEIENMEEYLMEELEKVFDPENYVPWMH